MQVYFKRLAVPTLMCMSLLLCSCFDVYLSPNIARGKVPIASTSDSIRWGLCYSYLGGSSIDFCWTVPKERDAYIKDSLPYLRAGDFMVYKDSFNACFADSLGGLRRVALPGKKEITRAYKDSIIYSWRFFIKDDVRSMKVICPQRFLKLDGKNFLKDSIPVKWSIKNIRTSFLPGKWGYSHTSVLVLDK